MVVGKLSRHCPDAAKGREVWEAMQEAKDQKIVKQLRLITSSASSLSEVASAQKEVRDRVATRIKDVLKPQLEAIVSLPAMTLLDHEGAEQLLDHVTDCLKEVYKYTYIYMYMHVLFILAFFGGGMFLPTLGGGALPPTLDGGLGARASVVV